MPTHEATVTDLVPVDRPAPVSALVLPTAPLAEIEAAFVAYQQLSERLLVDSDYQSIGGKQFRKRSAWRKMAVAYGVSCSVIERSYERDDDGNIVRAELLVRATAPNGRHMDGLGACDLSERQFSHPGHDIPATAHTRAVSRACSDLFGLGEVSAEEVVTDPGAHDHQPPPRRAQAPSRSAAPTEPVPEGFATHAEAMELHGLVAELIKALPESVDRAPLRAYKAEKGWPMSKDLLEALASLVGEARRDYDEGEGRPFEDTPAEGAQATPQPAGTEEGADAAQEHYCAACGVAEAVTIVEDVELCASCEAEELGAAADVAAANE